MNRLQQKVAIITGASSGIGQAIADAFMYKGATVMRADRNDPVGPRYIFQKTDVTSAEQVKRLIEGAVRSFGRLDIMVNCAGIAVEASTGDIPVWDVEESTWDANMSVNAKGVFLGCKYAAAQMVKQDPGPNGDRGWIINLGSVVGLRGLPGVVSYCASKHAVVGITKAVALDCAPFRVRCNAICPGWTETAMVEPIFAKEGVRAAIEALHPFRGLGQPEDIAKAAVFLASEDSSWVTGTMLSVDGGYTAK
ncbi:putative short chain type dehydrogenase [Tothia fuscella]|uniref:Short chain type dehydrogenase n=1 Tax=Tothia fuscella TaxID=1048955 RepID=A0A9P4TWA5_9PEZI|nr:putative short chain type dehydrogenase [Tothia fuscella]